MKVFTPFSLSHKMLETFLPVRIKTSAKDSICRVQSCITVST